MAYTPPFSISSEAIDSIAAIGEFIGRFTSQNRRQITPQLRRRNRIRTIQASLAIEQNSLSLEQVTALLDGKRVLGEADALAEATPFIVFMLQALHDALLQTDPASDSVSDPVADPAPHIENPAIERLLPHLAQRSLGSTELRQRLELTHRHNFRRHYLTPALEQGWIERTQPDTPNSPTQRYRLTAKGQQWLRQTH
ncbi:MAG: hypothetical protein HQL48_06835 [Gammaproteobacteria bacterium]|nr:hypothetical protein [Gammaproteobacteria bacterium]